MPREIVYTGRRVSVAIDTFTAADGSTVRRDFIVHPGAVVILPVLDAETVVLLRNHRWVVGETLWEVPAGTREPNEPLEACARRELAEETGYTAARWTYLGFLYASPGVMNEQLHLFVAEDLTPGPMALEADEQLEPVTVPLAEAVRMCLSGEVKDAKTITSLLLWERRAK
ncbi:NUDIX hydrolase [Urbifossiella limnaea]|uniref:GDP-mannose pyrophosphatase n=1 Tax=Urbifossiella limnaea TaxID=2528023 RepID=A0A517XVS4_9BACT|nr:NUDIX hydrolase [Urbifossiella limnaea]QDU21613.1 ADP-ribose pyrophosphatase [Urbifossiella limnaea]